MLLKVPIVGVARIDPTTGASSLINFPLGRGAHSERASKCQVAEFLIFEGLVDEVDRLKIEGYLAHKWAIPLPSSHPWANDPPAFGQEIISGSTPVIDTNRTFVPSVVNRNPANLKNTSASLTGRVVNTGLGVLPFNPVGEVATTFSQTPGLSPPVLGDINVTNISQSSANFVGELLSTGGENPEITIVWGKVDHGSDANLSMWDHSLSLGTSVPGAFTLAVGDLEERTAYFFRVAVSNSLLSFVSDQVGVFVTLSNASSIPSPVLWLDANDSSAGTGTWLDKSGQANNAIKNGSPTLTGQWNNLPVMNYNGSNGNYHEFTEITDARTIFWVLKTEKNNWVWLIGDNNRYPFHPQGTNVFATYANPNGARNGIFWTNGADIHGSSAKLPTNYSWNILVSRAVSDIEVSNFSNDRNINGRYFKGDLAELIIYNKSLSDDEIKEREGYLAQKWGLQGNLANNHPFKSYYVADTPTISNLVPTSINIGQAFDFELGSNLEDANFSVYNIPADLNLTTVTTQRNPTSTPNNFSNLELWLDANHSSASSGTWQDRSSKGNNAIKTGSPSVIPNAQNGLPLMEYNANGQRHKFSMLTNIRTVFWVISQDSSVNGSGFRYMLSDSTKHPNWHNQNNGKFWSSNGWTRSWIKYGITQLNGSVIDGITTDYPNNLSIVSVRTTGNADADCFGYERGNTGRQWIGNLGELLIYSSSLSDADVEEVEGYLAHKWGLRSDLPASHRYNQNKTTTTYRITGTPSVGGNYKVSVLAQNPVFATHGILDLTVSSTAAQVTTSPPSSVTSGTANILGSVLQTGGQEPLVSLYWGDEDGGNVAGNWDNNFSFGARGKGAIAHLVTGLSPSTEYYYSFSANNDNGGSGGVSWSNSSSFLTDANTTLPVLSDVFGVSEISLVGAKFTTVLKSTGGDENTTVTFYWGEEDGETNPLAWSQSIVINEATVGSINGEITSGLGFPRDYFMRVNATNQAGSVWSTSTVPFTPQPGDAGFTPIDFSGLKLWLDASDLIGTGQLLPLSNGGEVSQIIDKSGQSRHASQAVPTSKPSFVYGQLNGNPNISFDGANDYLEFEAIDTIRTLFLVVNRKTGNRGFLLGDDTNYHFHAGGNAIWSRTWTHPNVINGLTLINGNLRGDVLGTDYAYDTPTMISIRTVGGVRASNFSKDRSNEIYWKGNLAEMIVYNEELPTSILRKVEGYLAHKWGLSSTLTGTHPYRHKSPTRAKNVSSTKIFWGGMDGGTDPSLWDNEVDVGEVGVGLRKLTSGVSVLAEPQPNQSGSVYTANLLLDGNLPEDGWRSTWTAWFKEDPLLTFNMGGERLMNKIRIYFQPTDRADEFKEVEIWVADEEMNFSLLKTEPGVIGIRGQGVFAEYELEGVSTRAIRLAPKFQGWGHQWGEVEFWVYDTGRFSS